MLASGQISADEAEELLTALLASDEGRDERRGPTAEHARIVNAMMGQRREAKAKIAKALRIVIESGNQERGDRGRVAVTIPVALAKFAGKLIPEEARTRLEDQGIDLEQLLQALDGELPEGRLVDIDTAEDGEGRARIIVEVS